MRPPPRIHNTQFGFFGEIYGTSTEAKSAALRFAALKASNPDLFHSLRKW
ncbi:MAG: hypothetical protein ACI97A_003006, partial [Planctomycetota bacterium]